jgi:ACT domain-containing protein
MRSVQTMKAVITVVGKDRVGIIAGVSAALAENGVNILDISQTILQDYFTMIMLVELDPERHALAEIAEKLNTIGESLGVQIRVQHDAIFTAMHRV